MLGIPTNIGLILNKQGSEANLTESRKFNLVVGWWGGRYFDSVQIRLLSSYFILRFYCVYTCLNVFISPNPFAGVYVSS